MKTSKVYENSWEQVDVTEGHYRTGGAIVVALGGWEWPEAIAGAKELVAKCEVLGGTWHMGDCFTKLRLYFHAHQERFRHKWGLFEEQFQVGKNKLFLEQQAQTQGTNPTIEGLSVGGSSGSGTDKSAEVIAAEVIAAATEASKAGAKTTLKAAAAKAKAAADKTDSKESVADKKLTAFIRRQL